MELPETFSQKYHALLGAEATGFFAALTSGEVQKGFRYNPLKPDCLAHVEKFYPGALQPAPYAATGFLGAVNGKSLLHQAGLVYSQEPSAMIVAEVAAAQPGEKVLDLCAAPGGKSTQLAGQLQGEGLLVANEIMPKRAKILSENLERWGVRNALVTNHAPAELVKHFSGFFDRILVDAPCSGEGMFRKDPEAVAQWTPELPVACAARQKEILTAALQMLKNGGTLIYSTCTFAPEEDEMLISWLLENYPVTLDPIVLANTSAGRPEWGNGDPALQKTVRLWPHQNQGEGHFVAKLTFHGENATPKRKPAKKARLTSEAKASWEAFSQKFPQTFTERLVVFGDQLWQLPAEAPTLTGLKVLRPGLHLGTLKKKRFEPSLALALAQQNEDWPQLAISLADWEKYVAGETFPQPGNQSWVVLQVDHITVGFGKQVQGVVKNFYPKGLRFQV